MISQNFYTVFFKGICLKIMQVFVEKTFGLFPFNLAYVPCFFFF